MGVYKAQNFSSNQYTRIYDSATGETLDILGAKVKFYDDFHNTVIEAVGGTVRGWTLKDTGAATEAIIANQSGGVVGLDLTNAAEKQEAGIYFGDALNFNVDKGIVFESRVAVHTLPTDQAELYFGMANAYVEGPIAEADAGPTIHSFFCFDGDGACKLYTDDNTTNTDATATGKTVLADAYHIYRMDIITPTSVKFYYDGARVGSSVTHDLSAGANVVLQPFLISHKEAGAGVGGLYVDYVKVWQLGR